MNFLKNIYYLFLIGWYNLWLNSCRSGNVFMRLLIRNLIFYVEQICSDFLFLHLEYSLKPLHFVVMNLHKSFCKGWTLTSLQVCADVASLLLNFDHLSLLVPFLFSQLEFLELALLFGPSSYLKICGLILKMWNFMKAVSFITYLTLSSQSTLCGTLVLNLWKFISCLISCFVHGEGFEFA
jgi:hypothetical protein